LKNSITKTPLTHDNGESFTQPPKNGLQAANQMFSAFPEMTLTTCPETG
jgi:hypothetical protein